MGPSSPPGWVESLESVASEITSSQKQQMWLRKSCLEHDRNQCVLSGSYNFLLWDEFPDDDPIRDSEEEVRTQAAHTVPISRGLFDISRVSALSQISSLANIIVHRLQKANAAWDALWRAFPSMRSQVNFGPEQINNPYNALTLDSTLHVEISHFSIAFESTVSRSPKFSATI